MFHDLKITPPYFKAVEDGRKTFEIRQNDRGFQAGDYIRLREWDENNPRPADWLGMHHQNWKYTGRELTREITYVTGYEQKPNFVVFAFKPIEV